MSIHVMRCPDSAEGGAPAEKLAAEKPAPEKPAEPRTECTAAEWRAHAAKNNLMITDLNLRFPASVTDGDSGILSDDMVRVMLGNACMFLHQVLALTSGVLDSITVGQLRELVGHDIAIPAGIIRRDKKVSGKETPPTPEQAPDRPFDVTQGRDGRKNPRGRKHPLVALIELAAKAAKLLDKITIGLNPEAHDREPLASRIQARADELEQKRHTANSRAWS